MSQKIKLEIKGMHCRSCEILLERSISAVEGIKKVRVNHKQGIADIEYSELNKSAVEQAVTDAGYSIGKEDTKHFFSRNSRDYIELAAVAIILLNVYLLLKKWRILSLDPSVYSTPGLFGVFIIGLTAGVSTCMALIGGLVLGISARHAERHPEASTAQKFRPHIFFNVGRLLSYVVLGGLIGLLGSAFQISDTALGLITLLLGLVMLFLGLKLIDIFPKLHNQSITLPNGIARMFGLDQNVKEYSHTGSFVTGALTFFVPCGFTQAMQLLAISSGSFGTGALIMGIFVLGTLPGILGVGGLTSVIKGDLARYFFKFAGLVVIVLAVFNIRGGYTLAGFGPIEFEKPAVETAPINEGVQIVEMQQNFNGYSPSKFTVKKGIPVVWKITSTHQYTCAAFISMPDAGIRAQLKAGENIFEFTPTKTGNMRFTCSMGMYSGNFKVID
jgi:uncharacterized protein